jgi:hypothetical protein
MNNLLRYSSATGSAATALRLRMTTGVRLAGELGGSRCEGPPARPARGCRAGFLAWSVVRGCRASPAHERHLARSQLVLLRPVGQQFQSASFRAGTHERHQAQRWRTWFQAPLSGKSVTSGSSTQSGPGGWIGDPSLLPINVRRPEASSAALPAALLENDTSSPFVDGRPQQVERPEPAWPRAPSVVSRRARELWPCSAQTARKWLDRVLCDWTFELSCASFC